MIILLFDEEQDVTDYIAFLKHEANVPYIPISITQLVNDVKVEDNFLADDCDRCVWVWEDKVIDFTEVTGMYYSCKYPGIEIFSSFLEDDRNYARQEWLAYIMYRQLKIKNVINPLNAEIISGSILSLPNIYSVTYNIGISIPNFIISSDKNIFLNLHYTGKYVFKRSLYDYKNLSKFLCNYNEAVMAVEMNRGAQVIVYVLDNLVVSNITYKEYTVSFSLPQYLKNKCIQLVRELNLILAEIFFIRTSNDEYILYYITPFINWELACDHASTLYKYMTIILTKQD